MNSADLILIIDESGSMSPRRHDVIGGINAMLREQRALPGDLAVTQVHFGRGLGSSIETLHKRAPISLVPNVTEADYNPSGNTPLNDAIGRTLSEAQHWAFPSADHKVIVVINTDGAENFSREWKLPQVRVLVEALQARGWQFLFQGANIDAFAMGASYGFANNQQHEVKTSKGVLRAYNAASAFTTQVRGVSQADHAAASPPDLASALGTPPAPAPLCAAPPPNVPAPALTAGGGGDFSGGGGGSSYEASDSGSSSSSASD